MTKPFESIRGFAERTRPTVLSGAWEQICGRIDTGRDSILGPCCIGAKLAMALGAHNPNKPHEYEYRAGIRTTCERLACNEMQLIRLIHACGLNPLIYPFSAHAWNLPRRTVWDRMAHIEALPEFTGLDGNPTAVDILACVREANHAFWRRHYGIDERELPTESVEAFWTEFEVLLGPDPEIEMLLEAAPVRRSAQVDRAKVEALWADLAPRVGEWERS